MAQNLGPQGLHFLICTDQYGLIKSQNYYFKILSKFSLLNSLSLNHNKFKSRKVAGVRIANEKKSLFYHENGQN